MSVDARRPSVFSSELWFRTLLLASLRDERTDPFAPSDAQLLWELGLWPPSLPPFARSVMTEQDDAPQRFCHIRA